MTKYTTESTAITLLIYFVIAILLGMATWWLIPSKFAQQTVFTFAFITMVLLDIRNVNRKRQLYWKEREHDRTNRIG
jgi:hypothetical protein